MIDYKHRAPVPVDRFTFRYMLAPWYRRALYRWLGVDLPEVMLPEFVVARYVPGSPCPHCGYYCTNSTVFCRPPIESDTAGDCHE